MSIIFLQKGASPTLYRLGDGGIFFSSVLSHMGRLSSFLCIENNINALNCRPYCLYLNSLQGMPNGIADTSKKRRFEREHFQIRASVGFHEHTKHFICFWKKRKEDNTKKNETATVRYKYRSELNLKWDLYISRWVQVPLCPLKHISHIIKTYTTEICFLLFGCCCCCSSFSFFLLFCACLNWLDFLFCSLRTEENSRNTFFNLSKW